MIQIIQIMLNLIIEVAMFCIVLPIHASIRLSSNALKKAQVTTVQTINFQANLCQCSTDQDGAKKMPVTPSQSENRNVWNMRILRSVSWL